MNSEELQDLIGTMLDALRPELVKQSTAWNPLLAKITSRSGLSITKEDPILEVLQYVGSSSVASYAGFDTLPTAADDGPTCASFKLAHYEVPIELGSISDLERLSKAKLTELFGWKFEALANTYSNLFSANVYGDGTGNNGTNITGLTAAVAVSPTNIYGGIDRNFPACAFWKNQSFTATEQLAALATAQTIQRAWNVTLLSLTRKDEKPDLILAAPDVFKVFEDSLTEEQGKAKSKLAQKGFLAKQFGVIDVVCDTQVPHGHAYFLNTKFFNFRTYAKSNFVLGEVEANESSFVAPFIWEGNLTCNGAKYQGVWRNV